MSEEVRRHGYTYKKPDDQATLGDSTAKEFVKLKNRVNELEAKNKKLTNDIHGIKMQLGREEKKKKEALNILEKRVKEIDG